MALFRHRNIRLITTFFIFGDISGRLTFKMSCILQSPLKNMSKWIDLHASLDPTVKPGVEKIPVFVRLWATVIVIARWDGINRKLFRSALTWNMRKVGQDRGHCAYQYSIEGWKVICLLWQLCVERDKGLPRWLLKWSSQQAKQQGRKLESRWEVLHPEMQDFWKSLYFIIYV